MAQQGMGDVLRKGEEIFQNVSGKLLEKPAVAKAFEAALLGKLKVDQGVAVALKRMNVQTRSEFRGLKARVDALAQEVSELQAQVDALKASTLEHSIRPKSPRSKPRVKTRAAAPKKKARRRA